MLSGKQTFTMTQAKYSRRHVDWTTIPPHFRPIFDWLYYIILHYTLFCLILFYEVEPTTGLDDFDAIALNTAHYSPNPRGLIYAEWCKNWTRNMTFISMLHSVETSLAEAARCKAFDPWFRVVRVGDEHHLQSRYWSTFQSTYIQRCHFDACHNAHGSSNS